MSNDIITMTQSPDPGKHPTRNGQPHVIPDHVDDKLI